MALILVFEEIRSLRWATTCTACSGRHGCPAACRSATDDLPGVRLFASAACIVIALAMYWVVNRTRLGMMIRAGASNRDMVRGLGIDIRHLYRVVFAGGVALAALAGMIAAPMSQCLPGMGGSVLIICFVVVVIGGIGSITGALVASLLVGFVDTFGKVFFAEYSGIGIYLLMAVILVWRPEGCCPRGAHEHARDDRAAARGAGARRGAAVLTHYQQDLVVKSCAVGVRAQPGAARGHDRPGEPRARGVLGIGAYVTVLASPGYDAGSVAVLLSAGDGGAAAYALVVGALSLRTRGVYFIMVTLAFAQMAYFVFHDTKIGGGSDGIFLEHPTDARQLARPRATSVHMFYAALVALAAPTACSRSCGARGSAMRWPASA
jgi:ABC-type branched-subunit amino acid transport system permease subunit